MRSYLKTIFWAVILGFLLAWQPQRIEAQGDFVEKTNHTSYFYQPGSGSYEAVSSESDDPKAFLGIMIRQSDEGDGLEIVEFLEGSPAQAAGIPLGAVLLTMDGKELTAIETLLDLLGEKSPGDKVSIRYTHEGEAKTAEVKLGERPDMVFEELELESIEWEEAPNAHHRKMKGHGERPMREERRMIIRTHPDDGMMTPHGTPNTLELSEISVKKIMPEGELVVGFAGVTGAVTVYLMKQNGTVMETVALEDMQGPFEYRFVLGPGAQGRYQVRIIQDGKEHHEMIQF